MCPEPATGLTEIPLAPQMADVLAAAHAALHDEGCMDDLLRQLDRHRVRSSHQPVRCHCRLRSASKSLPPRRPAVYAVTPSLQRGSCGSTEYAVTRLLSCSIPAQAQTLARQAAACQPPGISGAPQPPVALARPQASSLTHSACWTIWQSDKCSCMRFGVVIPCSLTLSSTAMPTVILRSRSNQPTARACFGQELDTASASAIAAAALAVNAGDPTAALVDLLRVYLVDLGAHVWR